jgi:hypothetical protein
MARFAVTDNSKIGGEREVSQLEAVTPRLEDCPDAMGELLDLLVKKGVIEIYEAIDISGTGAYEGYTS